MGQRWLNHPLTVMFGVILLTILWLGLHTVLGVDLATGVTVALSGIAVLGVSFLLTWDVEAAEADVPWVPALAILAMLTIVPEYVADTLYAWEAGINPGTSESAEAANLAVANMIGTNRTLIGTGRSTIAPFTAYRARNTGDGAVESRPGFLAGVVRLGYDIATEILLLFAAAVFIFFVPLEAEIGAADMFTLVGLYVAYILVAVNSPYESEEQIDVPAYLQSYRKPRCIATTLSLFVFSGIVILVAVELFVHDLEAFGESVGIPSLLMIQWVAPPTSEGPKLIVVAYLVSKARPTAGFSALISLKFNQWTFLIGTFVLAYSLSLDYYGPLPLDTHQMDEFWLTVAQSYFAIAILIAFSINLREAIALLGLFSVQFAYSVTRLALMLPIPGLNTVTFDDAASLISFSIVYLVVGTTLFVRWRE